MDLKELDYIVTVANEGSISRAAEKLFMAQSSLSQAVRLFEQDLGTPIFVRTARGVRPTSAGEAFIFHARQILQQYQEARSEASDKFLTMGDCRPVSLIWVTSLTLM